ncbi:MbtH family protein [Clavibacter michiganensis]|uniref:MbtH family protein n=1 Tax=Clavibacter michiganensis subsp. insidiosus TaxID=33014 RepID=A0A399SRN3_9MICO|nr:MbtH family NRPS accessory protein [Clavibacter michiganensis]RIJ45102.1 MbtH family protein [Clavibacter michiganensis subsp. insidiosus]
MSPDHQPFLVVVNEEDQHALWPAWKPLPDGWSRTGFSGVRQECVEHVDRIWTDIRPVSVRTPREPLV